MEKVWALSFSPTGNTARAVETVAAAAAGTLPRGSSDLTLPSCRGTLHAFTPEDLVVVGTPTYAGRVPNKIAPDLRACLRGNGALAAAVVTFGNRAYDNALSELGSILEDTGFRVVAAGAFAARHAFTDLLGPGRPGAASLSSFGRQIREKVERGDLSRPRVPGDPEGDYYVPRGADGQPARFLKARPRTDPDRCTRCGLCAAGCPMGAIDKDDPAAVPGTCIKCQRCVRRCPAGAKYFDDPAFLAHVAMLEGAYQEAKIDCIFL